MSDIAQPDRCKVWERIAERFKELAAVQAYHLLVTLTADIRAQRDWMARVTWLMREPDMKQGKGIKGPQWVDANRPIYDAPERFIPHDYCLLDNPKRLIYRHPEPGSPVVVTHSVIFHDADADPAQLRRLIKVCDDADILLASEPVGRHRPTPPPLTTRRNHHWLIVLHHSGGHDLKNPCRYFVTAGEDHIRQWLTGDYYYKFRSHLRMPNGWWPMIVDQENPAHVEALAGWHCATKLNGTIGETSYAASMELAAMNHAPARFNGQNTEPTSGANADNWITVAEAAKRFVSEDVVPGLDFEKARSRINKAIRGKSPKVAREKRNGKIYVEANQFAAWMMSVRSKELSAEPNL